MTSTRLQNSSVVSSESTGYSTIRSVESESHETRQQKLDFIVNRFNSIPNHGRGKNPLKESDRTLPENQSNQTSNYSSESESDYDDDEDQECFSLDEDGLEVPSRQQSKKVRNKSLVDQIQENGNTLCKFIYVTSV